MNICLVGVSVISSLGNEEYPSLEAARDHGRDTPESGAEAGLRIIDKRQISFGDAPDSFLGNDSVHQGVLEEVEVLAFGLRSSDFFEQVGRFSAASAA